MKSEYRRKLSNGNYSEKQSEIEQIYRDFHTAIKSFPINQTYENAARRTIKMLEIQTGLKDRTPDLDDDDVYGANRNELVDGGVDINRSFQFKNSNGQVDFHVDDEPRYYTGPEANWCKESEALKTFIDSHKSDDGVNVFIDTHGYTTQILTSTSTMDSSGQHSVLHKIFSEIFLPVPDKDIPERGTTFDGYRTETPNGVGFVARYVHDIQGMDGCLFEFPGIYNSAGQIFDRGLHTRYIQAITNILTTYPR